MFRAFRKKSMRWKYALFKDSIDDLMKELETWQSTADPSWYLLLRMSNTKVDQVLSVTMHGGGSSGPSPFSSALKIRDVRRRHGSERADSGVFLPPRELDSMVIYETPLCSAKMAQRMSSRAGPQNLILTTLECPAKANVNHVAKEVRELASKLSVDDHKTFGLLSCKGVVRRVTMNAEGQQTTSFTMVFRSPDNESEMSSLRSKLLSRDSSVTLGDRFVFARQLAKSIAYIHTFGFVHKSVRPENVLVFPGTSPTSYLAGFDNFRKEEGKTYHQGLFEWEKNLYQHPQRQGLNPREDYVMQHDIYSLGVCLLEIGLWDSFVHYDVEGRPVTAPMLTDFARDCQSGRTSLAASKEYLVRLCEDRLPQNMGHTYYKVVKTCLTCLDPDNIDFGDEREFKDDDGILVGVRYIEKVCDPCSAFVLTPLTLH